MIHISVIPQLIMIQRLKNPPIRLLIDNDNHFPTSATLSSLNQFPTSTTLVKSRTACNPTDLAWAYMSCGKNVRIARLDTTSARINRQASNQEWRSSGIHSYNTTWLRQSHIDFWVWFPGKDDLDACLILAPETVAKYDDVVLSTGFRTIGPSTNQHSQN